MRLTNTHIHTNSVVLHLGSGVRLPIFVPRLSYLEPSNLSFHICRHRDRSSCHTYIIRLLWKLNEIIMLPLMYHLNLVNVQQMLVITVKQSNAEEPGS